MKSFFLTLILSLFLISTVGFATTKNANSSLTPLLIATHTANKKPAIKKRNYPSVKKAALRTKKTRQNIHQTSVKSKLHSKKSVRKAAYHRRHTSSPVQTLPSQLEDNDSIAFSDLAMAEPMSADNLPKMSSSKKSGFRLFGWGKEDSSTDTANNAVEEKRVTALAHKTVKTLHHSAYRFGGNHFDFRNGVYMLDCSGYVDNLLNKTSPEAYSTLAQWSGSYKPNSEHYYRFFSNLANNYGPDNWDAIKNSQKLQPGDILVFRYKNAHGKSRGGHVMLVMNKLEGNSDVVKVQVADSARTGHSADTRGSRSGIGIGTLLLKVNPKTGQPYAFAWRVDSSWNTQVNIAMGRPVNV